MRPTPLFFLLISSCATPGVDFHAQYAGKCRAENAPFAASVTQRGAAVDALRASFRGALDDVESELRHCYTEALANQPTTQGRIVLRVLVEGDGHVRRVVVPADNTGFPELACCVASIVQSLQLKAADAPGRYGFDYPFIFRTMRLSPGQTVDFVYTSSRKDAFEVVLDATLYQRAIIETPAPSGTNHVTEDTYASPGTPLE
jgi:hypothetical protein